MTTLSDRFFNSLIKSEGYRTTIYKDTRDIPTIGMGVALLIINKKTFSFRDNLETLATSLGLDWEKTKTALNDAKDVLNKVEGKTNPFKTATELLNPDINLAEEEKYGSIKQSAFKQHIWPDLYDSYSKLAKGIITTKVWNRLSDEEKTAIFSLAYNAPSQIGPRMKNSLNLYTVNGTKNTSEELTDSQFIGKMDTWYNILYSCNGGNVYGIENRRFYEANEFLGKNPTAMPLYNNAKSILDVDSEQQAALAVAFMNQYAQAGYNKLSYINGYKKNPYKYVQDNFSNAVTTFLNSKNHNKEYDLDTLFRDWNLITDLEVNRTDGTTSTKNNVTGTENDVVYTAQTEQQANTQTQVDENTARLYEQLKKGNTTR